MIIQFTELYKKIYFIFVAYKQKINRPGFILIVLKVIFIIRGEL